MTLIKQTNRVCKCGHKIKPDHDNTKEFFGIKFSTGRKCNGIVKVENVSIPCCCNRFLDRRYPTKFDTSMMITCFIAIGLTVFVFGSIIYILNEGLACHTDQCNKNLDKPMYNVREVGEILMPVMLLFALWTISWLFPSDYFRNKKRKTEPVQDGEKNNESKQ